MFQWRNGEFRSTFCYHQGFSCSQIPVISNWWISSKIFSIGVNLSIWKSIIWLISNLGVISLSFSDNLMLIRSLFWVKFFKLLIVVIIIIIVIIFLEYIMIIIYIWFNLHSFLGIPSTGLFLLRISRSLLRWYRFSTLFLKVLIWDSRLILLRHPWILFLWYTRLYLAYFWYFASFLFLLIVYRSRVKDIWYHLITERPILRLLTWNSRASLSSSSELIIIYIPIHTSSLVYFGNSWSRGKLVKVFYLVPLVILLFSLVLIVDSISKWSLFIW